MKRTILATALATGALAVPAYALASGGDGSNTDPQVPSTAPVQQEDQQQPRGRDCPEGQRDGSAPEAPDSGSGGGSSDTLL